MEHLAQVVLRVLQVLQVLAHQEVQVVVEVLAQEEHRVHQELQEVKVTKEVFNMSMVMEEVQHLLQVNLVIMVQVLQFMI